MCFRCSVCAGKPCTMKSSKIPSVLIYAVSSNNLFTPQWSATENGIIFISANGCQRFAMRALGSSVCAGATPFLPAVQEFWWFPFAAKSVSVCQLFICRDDTQMQLAGGLSSGSSNAPHGGGLMPRLTGSAAGRKSTRDGGQGQALGFRPGQ